jgi:hypothetical protein
MKKFIFSLILVALIVTLSFANVDRYNQGTVIDLRAKNVSDYDNCIGIFETEDQVVIVIKVTWADSSDQLHSKPIYIGDCNYADGYTNTITSAASDVNPIYHFSYDNKSTWAITTPATLDAVSSTAVGDTIGIEAGVNDGKYHTSNWLVVEFADGSTALNDDEYIIMVIALTKDQVYWGKILSPYARVATKSNTNP